MNSTLNNQNNNINSYDPFDYPSANRKDLMSLSKINSNDERIRKFKCGLNTERDYSYNLFNMDIIGM